MNFLATFITALALCQIATGSPISNRDGACRQVTEEVKLYYRIAGRSNNCLVYRVTDTVVVLANPEDNTDCAVSFWTKEPNYMEIYPVTIGTNGPKDSIRTKTILATMDEYTSEDEFEPSFVPVAQNTFYYKSGESSHFAFVLAARATDCSYVCELVDGDSGTIGFGQYTNGTFCQTYLQTTKNCQIQVTVDNLNIGEQDDAGDCIKDYVAFNKNGEPGYSVRNSQVKCGAVTDFQETSIKNKYTYVLKGDVGGDQGFSGSYEVVNCT